MSRDRVLGYAATSLVFVLLYVHAWRLRDALALDEPERLVTRGGVIDHSALAIVGCCSAVLALVLPARLLGIAGLFYFVVPVYFNMAGRMLRIRLRKLESMREDAGQS